MKLILNNDTAHALEVTEYYRSLNTNPELHGIFEVRAEVKPTLTAAIAVSRVINTVVTSIKVVNEEGEEVSVMDDIHAVVINFSEQITDDYHSCTVNLLIDSLEAE